MAKTGLLFVFFKCTLISLLFFMDEVYYKKKNLLVQRGRVNLIGTVCLDASKQSNITTLDRIQIESGIW